MTFTKENLRAISAGNQQNRITALKELLGYPIVQRDPQSGNFWYLRPGEDEDEALETCPIAVGFLPELNDATDAQIKQLLTQEKKQEVYGHYSNIKDIVNKPVMYLLLPTQESSGRIPLVLPTEGGLRKNQIQTFEWNDSQLIGRLERLRQGKLTIAQRGICPVPQVDWIFYEPVKTASELARALAEAARRIEHAIPKVYQAEGKDGYLHNLLKKFQKELLPTLQLTSDNEKDYSFADIYAQTIAYGLFTARVFSYIKDKKANKTKETDFNRQYAWQQLPETNPFLRKLFEDVSKQSANKLGEELVGAVADIFSILRAAKMDAILSDFEMKMNREDIVIRFYEDFLAAYKPQMRERRGVYYTPEPVVSYMVRSVDILLKKKFNKPLGLADPEVMILDPACGTGTYLLWVCQLIYQRFQSCPEALTEGLEDKSWSGYVTKRLLPRIFGFELLMAPYAIAHLKLGLFLEETGYLFNSGKRLSVYLTNTLDDAVRKTDTLFEEFIAQEADQATEIKRDLPIMVVLGNPPYSANSANTGEWASNLVRNNYYPKDEIKEHNPKLLLDDYVKFIRFAQWRIEQTGYGILSFITNHGYIDNPTFRGMRKSLMQTFDSIYTLDIHGNSKRKEKSPDGSKDENVFDIQQGVAIGTFVKFINDEHKQDNIYHLDLWGNTNTKLKWLSQNNFSNINWNSLTPRLPFCLFYPQNNDITLEYENYWKITEIMPLNSIGIKTHRDHFVIDFDELELYKRIQKFRNLKFTNDEIKIQYLLKDTRDWKLNDNRLSLAKIQNWEKYLTKCLYRPFDKRAYYYHDFVVEHPKNDVMQHMLEDNLCFLTNRQIKIDSIYHTWVTDAPVDCHLLETANAAMYAFPLYLYQRDTSSKKSIFTEYKRPNLSDNFLSAITCKLSYTPTPEAIFYYIYAIFHSPSYRTRYADSLKTDFPRVPLTSNNELFCQLAEYGEELVALHLMKSPNLDKHITKFVESKGNRAVDPGHPKYSNGAVTINKLEDKFTGVPEEVWNFHVGGYQVCQKWLKDRKGRRLSDEDIQHYQRIVVALKETIALMKKIDDAIPGFPIQ
ncbi:adenine specific DNA methyltransferase [Calothrix sp. PCC 7716]|nr:adenine specific DNA methyltransferase [Calothrix sp. PCC 7716]